MSSKSTSHQIDELDAIVGSLYEKGRYQEAIEPARRSVTLARQLFGERSPRFATSLNNLALLYVSLGNYEDAEQIYKQVVHIDRTVFGESSPEYATSLNSLAKMYQSTGSYSPAEELFRQSMEINRAVLGERHPEHAMSLNNLGVLYYLMGDYSAAEPLLVQALRITESVLGEEHPDYAATLNNIAMLYSSMGNYVVAKPLYEESSEIRRRIFGEQHPMFAESLDNLASLYYAIGNYSAAEPLCRQALEINRSSGEQRLEFATSLNNLATVNWRIGDYSSAEQQYKQAAEIYRAVLGEQHSQYAMILSNLAMCYSSTGEYSKAEQLYRQAIKIKRSALGGKHPSLATSLGNLASVLVAVGKSDQARAMMEESLTIDDGMIGQVFSISSERQRTAYIETVRSQFHIYLSLISQYLSDSPEALRSALSVVLRRKGIELEALAAQRDAILSDKYPQLAPLLREATILRTQIAQKKFSGPGQEGAQAHQQMLADWNTRKERIEMELARRIPEVHLKRKIDSIDPQVVALALPPGAALIEFVRFNLFEFKALPALGELRWKPERYLCFVILSGEPDYLAMIDLGEAEPIDQMIATFRATITGEEEGHSKRSLGRLPYDEQRAVADEVGVGLCQCVFSPFLKAIGNRNRLLISPDGDLSRLPFEVLPLEHGRRLIDEYRISYVGAGRDVIRFNARSKRRRGRSLVVADPDFDFDSNVTPVASGGRRSADPKCFDGFSRLPGTRLEGERIVTMLDADLWLESNALDARLKQCRSPVILHLATHGFFLEDQKQRPTQDRLEIGAPNSSDRGIHRLTGKSLESPLLRSGFALAGVNTWLKQGELMEEAEDGLVTAEDISALDLLDTELVVLSACETGLGEVRAGEGVLGLRRAFVLAGAKTLVMSLWKVPDEQTCELMEDFYKRILAGEPRVEALREAQLAIKTRYPKPFYWGAFICQGDPGPLKLDKESFDDEHEECLAMIGDRYVDSLDAVIGNRVEEILSRGPFPKCGGCGIEPFKPLVPVTDKKQNSGFLCGSCVEEYGDLLQPGSIRNFWMCGVCGYRVLAGTEIDAAVDSNGNPCLNCGIDVNISLINLEGDRPVGRGLFGEPIED